MAAQPGRKGGFTRTSALLGRQIRQVSEGRGFAVTRLLTHWHEVVGPDIARIARPVDVKYGRQGMGATLTILCTGAQAPMLEMQKEQLRAQVNAVYGYNAIARIRITQTAPHGFAEGQAVLGAAPKAENPKPDAATCAEAAEVAAPVGDDDLRQALERLAQNVISKNKNAKRGSE